MKLTSDAWLRITGKRIGLGVGWGLLLLGMTAGQMAGAQAVSTTTVQGTVYLANGQAGAGTLTVSWPSFTTANGLAVAAGRTTLTIGADGFLSINLTPNVGATPAGLYYTAVFQMSDGTTSTEYWVVPAAAQATLAAVQAQLMPAAQAVQAVSKAYVDQSISELTQSLLTASGGSLSGPLYLNADPTQPSQAATKHYVDTQVSTAVPLAGGNMTGGLQTPAVNGVQSPAAGSAQTTLEAAMTAAGTNGAMQIPPGYAGTDGFTNPNGVRVTDLRTTGAQQAERSVKEFGAVCDGVTDDTNALQAALNYANAHHVALTIPEGTCKTRTLNWRGESIGGLGKQVSALMGFPGQDVLATVADSMNLQSYTRIHDLTIYVDQSVDVSCAAAEGRAAAGSCAMNRPMEGNSIFSPGGNGQTGTAGTGAAWSVGNCAMAMPAATGGGGNGLKVAEIENVEIAATGTDPMTAEYAGAHSTHTCGLYLAQWPQWSEFRKIDIRGLNTGVAIPALPVTAPAGLNADSNRWQDITIQATHAFTAAAGSNNVLDNVVALAGNSAATGETPTGLVLDLPGSQQNSGQGWTVRNAVVMPSWVPVEPQLTVTAAGGAVTGVTAGPELGLGFDPYGTQIPLSFSAGCTAQATASVNANGSIGAITVTQGGVGCSATTTASIDVTGNWDTAAPVNLIGGQNMTFYAGNLLKGAGGYTVWNATGSGIYGTQVDGGGGTLPGGGSYAALVANSPLGTTYQVDAFPGADFGAKLQACVNALSTQYGGDCDARNFTGTLAMGSNLTIATANTTVQLPCATIATANQVIVTAGTRNVALHGCSLRGSSSAAGTLGGTVFLYSGNAAMAQVGDPTYATDTMGFHIDNAVINTTTSSSATAQGLMAYRTQEMDLESLYFLGNANQTGMTLDGTGNYTGGTFYDNAFNGFQTAVNAIGHQVANPATTDWMNASTFVRLHIDCPTSGGNPISGTYGINLQQGDGNTFTGGDVEGCSTAMHLGANAQNNTIVGLRNENSTSQVVADTGSSYNNWMTGGTMFTGALTDNGTRNSFLDTFHRSFNGLNGDYYGSQKDATVTNHFRIGIGAGNERGLLNRYQTDYGYRWTTGLSDATAGEQFYQILDELNGVYRLSIGQYNNGQPSTNNQTVINSAGTGAVVLNGSNNAGTGGVEIGSGGASESTVATISNTGNAQFNGTLQVGGATTFSATPTVKNQADAEIDATLWAGLTTSQKESLIYKDWNGNSQWYMQKDASNNWALNSATGGLDSFKAYQSTNSGDTYIDASNSTGAVRVNYENGSGAAFNIYGGNSSTLYASFTGTTAIRFPGLAASSGHFCLQVDNSGNISNTGSACGSGSGGSNGTINSGNSGQIAYYTASGTTIGGTSAVSVAAGGTGATSATGALANLGGLPTSGGTLTGAVTGPSFSGNVNGVYSVTAYGAVGDCTGDGSTSGCTHNDTAIQNAINAAYTTGGSVYFPTNPSASGQTVYYTSQAINPKGVSMYGPPGGAGTSENLASLQSVAIRGAPGADVFDIPDPGSSATALASKAFSVRDLSILVDDTTNASSSFTNRFPGRHCFDAAMTVSTAVLTSSTQCEFQPGDVGQPISVAGAGASGATLVTTVSSWQSATQVTLAASASTGVTSAATYISVANLPVTQTIGNCGFAMDASAHAGDYNGSGPSGASFTNVNINTIDNEPSNYTCAYFFQGNAGPYQTVFNHGYAGGEFGFIFVPANTSAGQSNSCQGICDLNVISNVWIGASYPFIAYGGNHETLRDFQISNELYGPQILWGNGAAASNKPYDWHIDIPEMETASSTCQSGTAANHFRVAGVGHVIDRIGTPYCTGGVAPTIQWDANDTSTANFNLGTLLGALNISGNNNDFRLPTLAGASYVSGNLNVTGTGNKLITGENGSPFDGIQPAREQYASGSTSAFGPPQLSRGSIVFDRRHDFINRSPASYYFNDEDLWLWPNEMGGPSGAGSQGTVVTDSTSDSGNALQIGAAGGQVIESNGTTWSIGNQIPAGLIRVYFKIKASSSISYAPYVDLGPPSYTSECTVPTMSLTTSYQVGWCDANLAGDSGTGLLLGFPTPSTGTVNVAWIAIRPWQTDASTTSLQIGQTGTPVSGNQGNGALVQHSTGSPASGSIAAFDANGNTVAATATGSGNAVLATGPILSAATLTGATTMQGNVTLENGANTNQTLAIQPGTSTDETGAVEFNNYSGSSEWQLRKDASNYLRVTDAVNSLDREVLYQNGNTMINAGAGSSAVVINNTSGSGTGGFAVYEGGSNYSTLAFQVTGSGNTTATGFLQGNFMIGSSTMTLATGSAAGTSPSIACASSHVCDGVSGTVTLTTGTSPTTGTLATLSFPNTHTHYANCIVSTESASAVITSDTWTESTTAITITANTAPSASTAYTVRYWCGGN